MRQWICLDQNTQSHKHSLTSRGSVPSLTSDLLEDVNTETPLASPVCTAKQMFVNSTSQPLHAIRHPICNHEVSQREENTYYLYTFFHRHMRRNLPVRALLVFYTLCLTLMVHPNFSGVWPQAPACGLMLFFTQTITVGNVWSYPQWNHFPLLNHSAAVALNSIYV